MTYLYWRCVNAPCVIPFREDIDRPLCPLHGNVMVRAASNRSETPARPLRGRGVSENLSGNRPSPERPSSQVADAAEARRSLALRLAVELRRSQNRDITSGHVTRTARAFEAYLQNGTVER